MHILMMTKAHQGIHRLIPPFHMHYLTSFYSRAQPLYLSRVSRYQEEHVLRR